jgi:hypothetical protein
VHELRAATGTAPIPDEQALVAGLATLEDVVRRPDLALVEVIVQDEYTHDVIVRRGDARYLVFDTT